MTPRRRRSIGRRRGVTIIVVLGLVSITLAMSYAMLRAQSNALAVQANARRRLDAKHAAHSGLLAAIRKMHQNDWSGVGTTFTGRTSATETFSASYAAGDATLAATSPLFGEQPYRVTVTCTGNAQESGQNGTAASQHVAKAVVRLVPRKLSDPGTDWQYMKDFTVYQYAEDNFIVDPPCRVAGPVRVQGELEIGTGYEWNDSTRWLYLYGLERMRAAGSSDMRPIAGPVTWRTSKQDGDEEDAVHDLLGVTATNLNRTTMQNWPAPVHQTTYRLYPGGKLYDATVIGDALQNVTLKPDPLTNPLGLLVRNGSVEIKNNVTIEGMLVATVDVQVTGQNVSLRAAELLPLSGTEDKVRLQLAWTGDDFRVHPEAGGSANGLVSAFDEFEFMAGTEATTFAVKGQIVSNIFLARGRSQWQYDEGDWSSLAYAFAWQLNLPLAQRKSYFPAFLAMLGRNPAPKLTVDPETGSYKQHWRRQGQTVYVTGDGDEGLRWELIAWNDCL